MEIPKIERYVSDLLTVSGFSEEGAERHLWVLLHHLYSAVAMYEHMSAEDKEIIAATQKKLKYFFETKCNLKETRKKNKETENFSPTPPLKEKEIPKEKNEKIHTQEKKDFSVSLEKRRFAFREKCLSFASTYNVEHLSDFFNYWSEETRHTGKMRFEAQRFWNLEKRLARWMQNHISSENSIAAIRLEKAKGKAVERQVQAEEDRALAAERERANLEREQQQEESKQGAVSYEEWVRMRKNKKD